MLQVSAHKGPLSGLLGGSYLWTRPSRFCVQFDKTSECDIILFCQSSVEREKNQGYLRFGDSGGQTQQIYLHIQLLCIRIITIKIAFRCKLRYEFEYVFLSFSGLINFNFVSLRIEWSHVVYTNPTFYYVTVKARTTTEQWHTWSALFWDITQLRVVILYRRFGRIYRSYLQGLRTSWPWKMGPIRYTETSVNDYHWTLRNTSTSRRKLEITVNDALNHIDWKGLQLSFNVWLFWSFVLSSSFIIERGNAKIIYRSCIRWRLPHLKYLEAVVKKHLNVRLIALHNRTTR
jgi:hypothetical protein